MRTFDEVLATVPHQKTFYSDISGTERTYHFTEEDRISAAREILMREEEALRPKPRPTAKSVTAKFGAIAERLERDAASIRGRVARASTSSQHVMRAEAAALERSARAIRAQIEELA